MGQYPATLARRGRFYGLPAVPDRYRGSLLGPVSPVPGLFLSGSDAGCLGIVGALMGGVAAAFVLAFGAGLPAPLVFGEYVPYLLYLAFGEATLTGMALTLMVVYRPQWVATFDDARYLDDG
jgi:hypothetical protein